MRSGEDSHLSWKKCSRASRRRKRLSKVDRESLKYILRPSYIQHSIDALLVSIYL